MQSVHIGYFVDTNNERHSVTRISTRNDVTGSPIASGLYHSMPLDSEGQNMTFDKLPGDYKPVKI